MKKFFLFLTLLTLGVGQMWGTTVNFSVGTYATAQSWTNATAYSSATIDSYITATKMVQAIMVSTTLVIVLGDSMRPTVVVLQSRHLLEQ